MWLVENNYKTITYGLERTNIGDNTYLNHFIYPLKFILKQIGVLLPFFILLSLTLKKFKFKINKSDEKSIFLIFITLVPFLLMVITSLVFVANIRTMWMTPFYLFFGLFFIYHFESIKNLNSLKKFMTCFLFIFILSPVIYLYISLP